MLPLFGGNPLSSPVGQRIDKATDGDLASEDWALNMEICDIINETDDGPKEAMRAIRKKMQANVGKNYKVILYSLTVLETCVKNCGRRFHVQVATKEFLQELVRIIGPKNDPPAIVQERILGLIQAWSDAFKGASDLKEVEKMYDELRAKGIEFPMTDLDSLAPIHTPGRSAGRELEPSAGHVGGRGGSSSSGAGSSSVQPAPRAALVGMQQQPVFAGAASGGLVRTVTPTPEQLAKLRIELDVVQDNCRVFNEVLNDLTVSGSAAALLESQASDAAELARELSHSCHQMQQRILELIECVSGSEVTEVLLQANDELNNVFLRYERYQRYCSSRSAAASAGAAGPSSSEAMLRPTPAAAAAGAAEGQPAYPLGPSAATAADLSAHLAAMNVQDSSVSSTLRQLGGGGGSGASVPRVGSCVPPPADDDFDMFAASRQSFEQSRAVQRDALSTYSDQQQAFASTGGLAPVLTARQAPLVPYGGPAASVSSAEPFRQTHPPAAAASATAPAVEDLLSADFNQFLLERARATDSLPDVRTVPPPAAADARSRQMQKDETEQTLFAL